MISEKELRNYVFKKQNEKFHKCLDPTMTCTEKPINAHSIQNARVLTLLERRGHVVMPHRKISASGPEIRFEEVGRNQASTFTGFCATHDNSIFRSLDTQTFDSKNPEHLFLLAYRSVTRELHAVMEGASRIQGAYLWRVDKGLDPSDTPSMIGIEATAQLMKSWETWKYRHQHFDINLVKQNWKAIRHNVFTLESQFPTIAVSALFSFDSMARNADVVRCALNVLPVSNDQTVIVFSYAKPDSQTARRNLTPILLNRNEQQKYELSKLIISKIENFAIAPDWFDSWSADKKKVIQDAFISTMFDSTSLIENKELMIFN
ncbi:MAG: hypothetical protein HQL33_02345 [Alphaproteobacteria bacterium]|nr:hypothetical protein [Alphaproteobacteria bacterium]